MGRARTVTENPIEYALLGLLYRGPRYGYELHRSLSEKTGLGLIWTVKQAQLYSILAKFEAHGLLGSVLDEAEGRPARKVFHLSPEGEALFVAWARDPSPRRDFRLEFLAKLHFSRLYFPSQAQGLVGEQRKLCLEWLAAMEEKARKAPAGSIDDLVYRYRVSQLRSMASWLEECRELVGGKGA